MPRISGRPPTVRIGGSARAPAAPGEPGDRPATRPAAPGAGIGAKAAIGRWQIVRPHAKRFDDVAIDIEQGNAIAHGASLGQVSRCLDEERRRVEVGLGERGGQPAERDRTEYRRPGARRGQA